MAQQLLDLQQRGALCSQERRAGVTQIVRGPPGDLGLLADDGEPFVVGLVAERLAVLPAEQQLHLAWVAALVDDLRLLPGGARHRLLELADLQAAGDRLARPAGQLEALRTEVQAVLDAHKSAVDRHDEERKQREEALGRQRTRAEAAESRVVNLLGRLAGLGLDLQAARLEISELRDRFESSLQHRS